MTLEQFRALKYRDRFYFKSNSSSLKREYEVDTPVLSSSPDRLSARRVIDGETVPGPASFFFDTHASNLESVVPERSDIHDIIGYDESLLRESDITTYSSYDSCPHGWYKTDSPRSPRPWLPPEFIDRAEAIKLGFRPAKRNDKGAFIPVVSTSSPGGPNRASKAYVSVWVRDTFERSELHDIIGYDESLIRRDGI
jgi:hypothetical protein